jgi:hypothetical protein
VNVCVTKRAVFPLLTALVGISLVVACGSDDDPLGPTATPDSGIPLLDGSTPDTSNASVPDGSTDPQDSGIPDTGGPLVITPTCAPPIQINADPTAQARAVTALAALDLGASLEWSDTRSTIKSISDLVVTPDCSVATTNLTDTLFDYLEASPDLFQIDRTEWKADAPALTCADISGFQPLILRRQKLGPYDLHNDVFSAVADVKDGHVIFRNFSGTYVPKPSAELLTKLADCTDLPDETLFAVVRTHDFTCQLFAPAPAPMCTIDGTSSYTAKTNDTVQFESPSELVWEETTGVEYRRQRAITVKLASANYSSDLLRSSANCADIDGNPQVGWVRTLDVASGKILVDHDSPDPFCSVCFAPPIDPDDH